MNFKTIITSVVLSLTIIGAGATSPIKFKGEKHALTGILIRDLVTGHDVISYNADKAFSPASTMKLVTSASALSALGADYRYTTTAYAQGAITNGVLKGNVIIDASGDPTLYSTYFPECNTLINNVVDALKQLGVTKIAGDIIVNDGKMPQQGPIATWEIEDNFYSYGAGHFALNFYDNVFKLNTEQVTTTPVIPDIDVIIEQTDSLSETSHGINSPLYIIRSPKVYNPDNCVTLPMYLPEDAFIYDLTTTASKAGIEFIESETANLPDSIPLTCVKSPRLSEIMRSLMVRSDNMMAEATLRLLAPGDTRDKAIENELELLKKKGIDCETVCIRDGSGLTRSNALTPAFLSDVLQVMSKDKNSSTFAQLFPRAGYDGTMKTFLANSRLKGRLALKTGSMSHVRCYAGYYLDRNGRPTHSVVIMVNNYLGKTSDLKKSIEQFLLNNLK